MKTSHRGRIAPSAGRLLVAAAVVVLLATQATAAAAAPWYSEPFNHGETDVFTPHGAYGGWRAANGGHNGAGLYAPLREGSHYGAQRQVEVSDLGLHARDEMYWRYWLRLAPDFEIEFGSRGKLPGPAGLYSNGCRGKRTSTESGPCWSARTMFSRPAYCNKNKDCVDQGHDQTLLGSYVYHLDGPGDRGDILSWDPSAGTVDHGKWHCVEGRVRMNTPGANDGVLQNWVDGDLAFDRRDFRFRRSSEAHLHVKSMWMEVYHGGSATWPTDSTLWLDSLALSPTRIGCGDERGYDFTDHGESVHRADVDWFAARGITRGCNPPDNTQYCPEQPVTRGQMAVFLTRSLELPPASGNTFHDDDGSVYESAIESLAAAGITRGCNPPANDRFCPDDPVTRGEMAAFLTRAWELPAGSADHFTDVDDSQFKRDIGALARADVTRGCNPPANDEYCPTDPVTRAQMATFVRRVAVKVPR